ncbi:MAG TPA: SulP family inorganic anion transporter, partial [Thermoanaerobaculia bacterium]
MESQAAAPLTLRAAPSTLVQDIWGGLAAMLVALPSSIAFGVVVYTSVGTAHAAEGALAGILGAAILGITAPIVSRNGGFITAPCAPAAAVMAGLATSLVAAGNLTPRRIFALMALTALLSASFQIIYGAIRAGRLIKFIPYQVVSGYLSGVAVIIAVGQLPKFLGVPAGTRLGDALASPEQWRWPGIVVGAATIVAMALAGRITKKIPAAIIGLFVGVATYFAIGFAERDLLRLEGNPLIIGPVGASGSLLNAAAQRVTSLAAVQFSDL